MKRKIGIGLAILAVIVVGLVVLLFGSMNSVVASAIRTYGPKITGVPVSIESVDIEPTKGTAELSGLVVGNPDGFETEHAFSLGNIRMALDVSSLGSDKIHIREIVIDEPEIIYELSGAGSNIDAIRQHIASLSSGKASDDADEEDEDGKEGPKLVIDNLVVSGANVQVSAAMFGGKTMSVPLPTVTMSDIGKEKDGASASEVVSKIMSSLSGAVSKAVSKVDLGKLKDLSGEALGNVSDSAGDAADSLKDGASDAADRLKGLFK